MEFLEQILRSYLASRSGMTENGVFQCSMWKKSVEIGNLFFFSVVFCKESEESSEFLLNKFSFPIWIADFERKFSRFRERKYTWMIFTVEVSGG